MKRLPMVMNFNIYRVIFITMSPTFGSLIVEDRMRQRVTAFVTTGTGAAR